MKRAFRLRGKLLSMTDRNAEQPAGETELRALEAAKDRAYSQLQGTHKRTTAALERCQKKAKFDRTRSYATIGRLTAALQRIIDERELDPKSPGMCDECVCAPPTHLDFCAAFIAREALSV